LLLALAGCGGDDSGGKTTGGGSSSGDTAADSGGSTDDSGGSSDSGADDGGSDGGADSGGSESSAPASGGSGEVTKAEFIKKADNACADFRKRSAQLSAKVTQAAATDVRRVGRLLNQLADEADETLARFRSLDVPAGDEQTIDRYLAANRESIKAVRRTAEAFQSGDTEAATRLLQSGQQAGADTRRIAQDYGFKVCGAGTG
jgi:hypothetical protein